MCEPFAMFPRRLLRAGLSHREQSVLLCLISYKNNDGEAWPSRATIAADTGLHISNVHKTVKSLAQKGMIAMITQSGVRTVYTFPCLDHTTQNLDMVDHAHAPVIAKSATTDTGEGRGQNVTPLATPDAGLTVPKTITIEKPPTADNPSPVEQPGNSGMLPEQPASVPPEAKAAPLPAIVMAELEAKTEELAAPAESIAQPAPAISDAAEQIILPVVVHESHDSAPQQALQIICAPQTQAAQCELLPAPVKRRRSKSVAVQGELLPMETKPRKTRLPDGWQLPRKWGEWAMEEYGFTEDEVRFHGKQFARHWQSSGESNAYKVNWYMAWQKWMGKEYKDKERYNNRPQQKSKTLQIIESFAQKYNGDFNIPF